MRSLTFALLASLTLLACGKDDEATDTGDTDVEGDADADADSDTDSDTDTDADTDTNETDTDPGDTDTDPGDTDPPTSVAFSDVYATVISGTCTGCHGAGAQGGLDMSTESKAYGNLVNAPSVGNPGATRVSPRDVAGSYFVDKLEGAAGIVGAQMPKGSPELPAAEIQLVKDWITDGANP